MRPLNRPSVAAFICVSAFALGTGCGGGDEPAGRSATVPAGEPLSVVATEYAFDPATIVLEEGGELDVELDNRGSLAHNLRVLEGEEDIGGTETFQGGESKTATIELEPGSYRMICSVGNHEELGMAGELEVR